VPKGFSTPETKSEIKLATVSGASSGEKCPAFSIKVTSESGIATLSLLAHAGTCQVSPSPQIIFTGMSPS